MLTTAQQFSGVAAQVRAGGADAVYIASYGNQQVQIVKQLRDNGVDSQLVSYSGYSPLMRWPCVNPKA